MNKEMNNIITQEEKVIIDALCNKYSINKYKINRDGSIDVNGNIRMSHTKIKILPLKFGKVSGNFDCSNNELTSLVGCPSVVGGNFYCGFNHLTSLFGCPTSIGSDSNFSYNDLTSLEGCPDEVGGDFYCDNNQLTSLEYCPKIVGGYFGSVSNEILDQFHTLYRFLRRDERKVFLKYQSYYGVWTPKFNIDGFNELISEIKDGLR